MRDLVFVALTSLAPGQYTDLVVEMDTSVVRANQGEIVISNNDADEGPYNLTLRGVVRGAVAPQAPEISVFEINETQLTAIKDGTASVIDFGTVLVDAAKPTKTFRFQNDGTNTLTLEQPQLPAGFRLTAPLALTSLAPGLRTISVYSSTQVTVENWTTDVSIVLI